MTVAFERSMTQGSTILGWVSSVHDIDANVDANTVSLEQVEADPTRCPDPEAAAAMTTAIEQARRDGNSLGGVVTCVVCAGRHHDGGWRATHAGGEPERGQPQPEAAPHVVPFGSLSAGALAPGT